MPCRQSAGKPRRDELDDMKRALQRILWANSIEWGRPNKINRQCCRYINEVRPRGFTFFDFIVNELRLSESQQAAILADPEIYKALMRLMSPGNYAGRLHRKQGPRHTSGALDIDRGY